MKIPAEKIKKQSGPYNFLEKSNGSMLFLRKRNQILGETLRKQSGRYNFFRKTKWFHVIFEKKKPDPCRKKKSTRAPIDFTKSETENIKKQSGPYILLESLYSFRKNKWIPLSFEQKKSHPCRKNKKEIGSL